MRPKPFRLGRLLEIRRLRERRQQVTFAAAARAVRQQEADLERAIGRQVAARDELRSLLTPAARARRPALEGRRVPLSDVMRYRTYLSALAGQAGRTAARLPALRQTEAAQRAELTEARRAVKVLKTLRDRQREAYRRWSRRREQRNLDELSQHTSAQRAMRSAQ